jgi:putative transposase
VLYVDNGGAFVSAQLKLICARLGIRVTHTPPYRPQGRGKQERYYRTVAEQFGVEADLAGADTLAELNRWFAAWVEQVYHRRVHRATAQTPLERWLAGAAGVRPAPDPAALARAFWWATQRTVGATRTVSLHGRRYQVDPGLVGRRVELRYDPDDPAGIWVFHHGAEIGRATPEVIGPHVDPALRTRTPAEVGPPTGIAYLEVVAADHAAALRTQLSYQPPLPVPDHHPDPDGTGHPDTHDRDA